MKPMDFSQVQILEVPESHVMSDSTGRQVDRVRDATTRTPRAC